MSSPYQDDSFVSVFRDVKPVKPLQKCAYSIEKDATGRHGRQLLEMLATGEREVLQKVQLRGENLLLGLEFMNNSDRSFSCLLRGSYTWHCVVSHRPYYCRV